MKIIHKIETYTSDGKPVLRFTVMNSSGAYMEFTNWGHVGLQLQYPMFREH